MNSNRLNYLVEDIHNWEEMLPYLQGEDGRSVQYRKEVEKRIESLKKRLDNELESIRSWLYFLFNSIESDERIQERFRELIIGKSKSDTKKGG